MLTFQLLSASGTLMRPPSPPLLQAAGDAGFGEKQHMLMLQSWIAQEKFRDEKAYEAATRNEVFLSCCHDELRRPLPLLVSDQLKTDVGEYSTHNKKIGKHLMKALVASLLLPGGDSLLKIDLGENQLDDACAPELIALLEGR